MTAPLYQIHQLDKKYNEQTVLNIEQLNVYQGEVLAIIGPSGSGKSTLLRILNFLEPQTRGKVHYAGTAFTGEEEFPLPLRRQVCMVFQRPALLRTTVAKNVAYGLRLRGERNVSDKVEDALERVGLSAFATRQARTLSAGEAQRVALARAMCLEPRVLLLDEPTSNLDPYNVQVIEHAVLDLNRRGATIILVTHNIFQARRLADRVGLLLAGQLVEIAPKEKFFTKPDNPQTLAFTKGEIVY